jgi:hypothetical protein
MKARGPGQSAILLLEVASVLGEQKIGYAVIGAMAASVHGAIRGTADADALLAITPAKLGQLEKVLKRRGFKTALRHGDPDDPIPALLEITDRYDNRVELLAGLRGLDPQAFARSITIAFRRSTLRIIGREDFIAMKCFAGGPQDIADVREVLNAADAPIDLDLLRRITRRFGRPAADALEQILDTRG